VTIALRLKGVEDALTPTQRVVAWLDEAHAFGDLETYARSLLDQRPQALPINRLLDEAIAAVRASLRGKPAEVIDAAVRKAARERLFRYDLVIRANIGGHETLDRESLVYAVLGATIALLTTQERDVRRADAAYVERLATCRDAAFARVDEMLAWAEARSIAEGRYLNGHTALFPTVA
jgi:hypothetical protein